MRLMDNDMIERHLENLDRRLAAVEQILPTLATKEDLRTLATKEELSSSVALLATQEELSSSVALLATKEELKALATKDDIRELRRYMDLLSEDQRGDIRLLAEHLAAVMSRLPER
jgi:hypothetical protein